MTEPTPRSFAFLIGVDAYPAWAAGAQTRAAAHQDLRAWRHRLDLADLRHIAICATPPLPEAVAQAMTMAPATAPMVRRVFEGFLQWIGALQARGALDREGEALSLFLAFSGHGALHLGAASFLLLADYDGAPPRPGGPGVVTLAELSTALAAVAPMATLFLLGEADAQALSALPAAGRALPNVLVLPPTRPGRTAPPSAPPAWVPTAPPDEVTTSAQLGRKGAARWGA